MVCLGCYVGVVTETRRVQPPVDEAMTPSHLRRATCALAPCCLGEAPCWKGFEWSGLSTSEVRERGGGVWSDRVWCRREFLQVLAPARGPGKAARPHEKTCPRETTSETPCARTGPFHRETCFCTLHSISLDSTGRIFMASVCHHRTQYEPYVLSQPRFHVFLFLCTGACRLLTTTTTSSACLLPCPPTPRPCIPESKRASSLRASRHPVDETEGDGNPRLSCFPRRAE